MERNKGFRNERGNILAHLMMLIGVLFVILLFVAILLFQHVMISVFHDVKNNLYMVNRNVLLALNREEMGVDQSGFYENKAKSLVRKEIERLWDVKVGSEQEEGIIRKIQIEEVKIRHETDQMYICSKLEIFLNPFIFRDKLKDTLKFKVTEETKIEKMKG